MLQVFANVDSIHCISRTGHPHHSACLQLKSPIIPRGPVLTVTFKTGSGKGGLSSKCVVVPSFERRPNLVAVVYNTNLRPDPGKPRAKTAPCGSLPHGYKPWSCPDSSHVFCIHNSKCVTSKFIQANLTAELARLHPRPEVLHEFEGGLDVLRKGICPMKDAYAVPSEMRNDPIQFILWNPLLGYQNADVVQQDGFNFLVGTSSWLSSFAGLLFIVQPTMLRPKGCQRFMVPAEIRLHQGASALVKICGAVGGINVEESLLSKPSVSLTNVVLTKRSLSLAKDVSFAAPWKPEPNFDALYMKGTINITPSICVLSGTLEVAWPVNTASMKVMTMPDDCLSTKEFATTTKELAFQSAVNVRIGNKQRWPSDRLQFTLVI